MGLRDAWRALWNRGKLSSEKAQEMAQKRWGKQDIREEVGAFSQMTKLMNEMDTFKQQQIQHELEMRDQLKEEIIAELQAGDEEDGGSSIEDALLLKFFGGVNPQTAAQAMPPLQPNENSLPQILKNPKILMLIQTLDSIPEDKLKGLLENLQGWVK